LYSEILKIHDLLLSPILGGKRKSYAGKAKKERKNGQRGFVATPKDHTWKLVWAEWEHETGSLTIPYGPAL